MPEYLSAKDLEALRRWPTCAISNAIELFNIRPRSEGFMLPEIKCSFPELGPMIGYAATARVRTTDPPMEGHSYIDRTDWWNHILDSESCLLPTRPTRSGSFSSCTDITGGRNCDTQDDAREKCGIQGSN